MTGLLTEKKIQSIKYDPSLSKQREKDRDGLYLIIQKKCKTYCYDYAYNGKRKTLRLGKHGVDLSLAEAREKLIQVKKTINSGDDPAIEKKQNTHSQKFSDIANDWLNKQSYSPQTYETKKQRFESALYPYLDKYEVAQIDPTILLRTLMIMCDRGAVESARRLAGDLRNIFKQLRILGAVDSNPAIELVDLLPKVRAANRRNFSHITDEATLKKILKLIQQPSSRTIQVQLALEVMPHLFLRPQNIRNLEWSYIDMDEQIICFPKGKMKSKTMEFRLPFSTQVKSIFENAYIHRRSNKYVFAIGNKPLSENTTTLALVNLKDPGTGEKLGRGVITSHGWRHTASTFLNSIQKYSPDAIEMQLSHMDKDRIRAVYNKAQYLEERRVMAQEWSDYLTNLVGESDE